WHTMTRTAKSPRLSQHLAEPFVEINPGDAARLNIQPDDLIALSNAHGRAIMRALISQNAAAGQLFAPMHWTAETASTARIDALVPSIVDPISGQPESKAAAVAAQLYPARWFGFAVSATALQPQSEYWARARVPGGWRMELAGLQLPEDWVSYARQLFALPIAEAATVIDAKRGVARIAFHAEGRLLAALFAGPGPVAVARDHLASRLNEAEPAALAGRPRADMPDPGATVCACLNVGINTIREAIQSGRALSVAALGEALGAGTSCGSCRPELAGLLTRFKLPEAAE
ncbi:MAG: molybdopterin dinucleotide binding domain-containing protein, partial [Cypionkella sp.]